MVRSGTGRSIPAPLCRSGGWFRPGGRRPERACAIDGMADSDPIRRLTASGRLPGAGGPCRCCAELVAPMRERRSARSSASGLGVARCSPESSCPIRIEAPKRRSPDRVHCRVRPGQPPRIERPAPKGPAVTERGRGRAIGRPACRIPRYAGSLARWRCIAALRDRLTRPWRSISVTTTMTSSPTDTTSSTVGTW